MSDYKEQMKAFKSSARFYRSNKEQYGRIKSQKEYDETYLQFLKEDLDSVDRVLDKIRDKCGSSARLLTYLVFVEERTQEDVAQEYRLSRRQLQYLLTKWLHTVFEDDETRAE